MAEAGKRTEPFTAFRYDLIFDQESFGGFSECTGLNLETQTQEYLEGGVNDHAHKFPTRTVQTNVLLKRGIVNRRLWEWYFKLVQGKIETRSVSIRVLDPTDGDVVMELRLRDAFPCKWNGPELNAAQSSLAVETLELCHQGLEWQPI